MPVPGVRHEPGGVVTVDGAALRVMPGSLARYYQGLGGEVRA